MGFTKITNISLTDRFVQQVENLILSGELAVGEKLPSARVQSAVANGHWCGGKRPQCGASAVGLS